MHIGVQDVCDRVHKEHAVLVENLGHVGEVSNVAKAKNRAHLETLLHHIKRAAVGKILCNHTRAGLAKAHLHKPNELAEHLQHEPGLAVVVELALFQLRQRILGQLAHNHRHALDRIDHKLVCLEDEKQIANHQDHNHKKHKQDVGPGNHLCKAGRVENHRILPLGARVNVEQQRLARVGCRRIVKDRLAENGKLNHLVKVLAEGGHHGGCEKLTREQRRGAVCNRAAVQILLLLHIYKIELIGGAAQARGCAYDVVGRDEIDESQHKEDQDDHKHHTARCALNKALANKTLHVFGAVALVEVKVAHLDLFAQIARVAEQLDEADDTRCARRGASCTSGARKSQHIEHAAL
eukprot:comp21289_c0_seq1/m.45617 comp21289_c0_seq1/g.45617  ORF comp21289_c0_seq1/g.45617 comp21289_c0_seq1/m.45617 type:complete len:351 (+) comp21289_c0_seq1:1116-2168(+)